MHPDERADSEYEIACGMRDQLNHTQREFIHQLKEWSRMDSQDAEQCLLGVISSFYKDESEKQNEDAPVDGEMSIEDLPF